MPSLLLALCLTAAWSSSAVQATPSTAASSSSKEAYCLLPPSTAGDCPSKIEAWTFAKGKCAMFEYGGCGANKNMFNTEKDCKKACGKLMVSIPSTQTTVITSTSSASHHDSHSPSSSPVPSIILPDHRSDSPAVQRLLPSNQLFASLLADNARRAAMPKAGQEGSGQQQSGSNTDGRVMQFSQQMSQQQQTNQNQQTNLQQQQMNQHMQSNVNQQMQTNLQQQTDSPSTMDKVSQTELNPLLQIANQNMLVADKQPLPQPLTDLQSQMNQLPQQANPMMSQANNAQQMNPNYQGSMQGNPKANPLINSLANPQPNPFFNPQLNLQQNQQNNPLLNPQANPQPNPFFNVQSNSLSNPQPNLQPNNQANPQANNQANPQANPQAYNQNPQVNPLLQQSNPQLQMNLQQFQPNNQQNPLMSPQANPDPNANSQQLNPLSQMNFQNIPANANNLNQLNGQLPLVMAGQNYQQPMMPSNLQSGNQVAAGAAAVVHGSLQGQQQDPQENQQAKDSLNILQGTGDQQKQSLPNNQADLLQGFPSSDQNADAVKQPPSGVDNNNNQQQVNPGQGGFLNFGVQYNAADPDSNIRHLKNSNHRGGGSSRQKYRGVLQPPGSSDLFKEPPIDPEEAKEQLDRIRQFGMEVLEELTSSTEPTTTQTTSAAPTTTTKRKRRTTTTTEASTSTAFRVRADHDPAACQARPRDPGQCFEFHLLWTFYQGTCAQFVYGGCGGSKNKFNSKEECREVCREFLVEVNGRRDHARANPPKKTDDDGNENEAIAAKVQQEDGGGDQNMNGEGKKAERTPGHKLNAKQGKAVKAWSGEEKAGKDHLEGKGQEENVKRVQKVQGKQAEPGQRLAKQQRANIHAVNAGMQILGHHDQAKSGPQRSNLPDAEKRRRQQARARQRNRWNNKRSTGGTARPTTRPSTKLTGSPPHSKSSSKSDPKHTQSHSTKLKAAAVTKATSSPVSKLPTAKAKVKASTSHASSSPAMKQQPLAKAKAPALLASSSPAMKQQPLAKAKAKSPQRHANPFLPHPKVPKMSKLTAGKADAIKPAAKEEMLSKAMLQGMVANNVPQPKEEFGSLGAEAYPSG